MISLTFDLPTTANRGARSVRLSCCVAAVTLSPLPSLQAPNRQLMTYWLQELQQKRWEYCSGLDMVKWDSRASPTPGDFSKGLVARDNSGKSQVGAATSVPHAQPFATAGQPDGRSEPKYP